MNSSSGDKTVFNLIKLQQQKSDKKEEIKDIKPLITPRKAL